MAAAALAGATTSEDDHSPHRLSLIMSRWFFPWSSSIKKRACRYLLQHYLGHFLEERLGLEQLSLDLYAGAGRLTRLHLDVWVRLSAPVERRRREGPRWLPGQAENPPVQLPGGLMGPLLPSSPSPRVSLGLQAL